MATEGFEFDSMLDGSNATPRVMDLPVSSTGAFVKGDLVLLNSSGYVARVTSTTTEVTGVMAETRTSGVEAALMKVAIIQPNQVWRCSMDATSTSFVVGYTKTIDTTDHNTVSASDSSGGKMILFDTDTDDDGYVLAYVVFSDTTFGIQA